jgi:hypothetical protein
LIPRARADPAHALILRTLQAGTRRKPQLQQVLDSSEIAQLMELTEKATPGSVAHLFGGLGSGDEEGEEDEEGEDGEESDDIPLSDRFQLSIFNKGQKRKREH